MARRKRRKFTDEFKAEVVDLCLRGGSQYASGEYQHRPEVHGVVCSMSRRGDCLDNAVAESFFGSLKSELIKPRSWPTRRQLIDALEDYIEVFYNTERLHSTLDHRTPAEVEPEHARMTQAAQQTCLRKRRSWRVDDARESFTSMEPIILKDRLASTRDRGAGHEPCCYRTEASRRPRLL